MDRQTATGIAAGVILAVVGGVSAIVLTTGPSIASALNGSGTEAVSDVYQQPPAEPAVYVVDEQGNLIDPSTVPASQTAEVDGNYQAANDHAAHGQAESEYAEHEEDEEYEDGDEYEDEEGEHDEDEEHEEDHDEDEYKNG